MRRPARVRYGHAPWRPLAPAEDGQVRTLPPAQVAARAGRTTAAAFYQRRYVLDVAHPHRPWTAAGDGLVMNLPPDQAAGHLRRTPTAVRLRARRGRRLGDGQAARRYRDLDTNNRQVTERVTDKLALTESLLLGERTLEDVAGQFRRLTAAAPRL